MLFDSNPNALPAPSYTPLQHIIIMGICDQLWSSYGTTGCKSATEAHPFLVAMLDGTLPVEKFRHYVLQDALYLTEFAYCLRLLGKKSPNSHLPYSHAGKNSESVKHRFDEFAKGAEEAEMGLHKSYFNKWNIKPIVSCSGDVAETREGDEVDYTPTTLMYTSYMRNIVATRPFHEGVFALLPCFWVYAHIGSVMLKKREEMKERGEYGGSEYDAWIDMYASDEFEAEVDEYKSLCEEAAKGKSEAEIMAMKTHFDRACTMEYMFWSQSLNDDKFPSFGN